MLVRHPVQASSRHSLAQRRVRGKRIPCVPADNEDSADQPDYLVPATASKKGRRSADSTDPIASFLSRRFGLAGGLAWLAVLTFGVVSERVKTRNEVAREISGTQAAGEQSEVVTASGLRYTDLVLGGGETPPRRGFLLAIELTVSDADSQVLYNTATRGRPLAFFYGARPRQLPLCLGVEEALASMRAGGVRRAVVPAPMAFGTAGAKLDGVTVPPDAELTFTIRLLRVSPPPS